MQCPKCGMEMMVDHVEKGGTPVFVCRDPKCSEYRKAVTESGDSKRTLIEERG